MGRVGPGIRQLANVAWPTLDVVKSRAQVSEAPYPTRCAKLKEAARLKQVYTANYHLLQIGNADGIPGS